jgi:hypothetical protein
VIRVERHPYGARLYLAGVRCHHGSGVGALAVLALALRHRRLALALASYAATDWRDFPFRDSDNHRPRGAA